MMQALYIVGSLTSGPEDMAAEWALIAPGGLHLSIGLFAGVLLAWVAIVVAVRLVARRREAWRPYLVAALLSGLAVAALVSVFSAEGTLGQIDPASARLLLGVACVVFGTVALLWRSSTELQQAFAGAGAAAAALLTYSWVIPALRYGNLSPWVAVPLTAAVLGVGLASVVVLVVRGARLLSANARWRPSSPLFAALKLVALVAGALAVLLIGDAARLGGVVGPAATIALAVGVALLLLLSRWARWLVFLSILVGLLFTFPPAGLWLLVFVGQMYCWWLYHEPMELWPPRPRWRPCVGCQIPSSSCERARPYWSSEPARPEWARDGVVEYVP